MSLEKLSPKVLSRQVLRLQERYGVAPGESGPPHFCPGGQGEPPSVARDMFYDWGCLLFRCQQRPAFPESPSLPLAQLMPEWLRGGPGLGPATEQPTGLRAPLPT